MTTEQFETWSMYIGIAALIFFMFFIIYDLGKKSEAGKFGNFILFLALGLGMVGFLVKVFLQNILE
jgi:FtsH-binding integral membrane protein